MFDRVIPAPNFLIGSGKKVLGSGKSFPEISVIFIISSSDTLLHKSFALLAI